jgi:autotransporter translocation and assembly factor TamB
MQRRNFALLTVIIVLAAVAAWAADITGTWNGSISGPNGDFSLTYTFKQDGDKLSGTVTGPQGDPLPLVDCKIDGDKISFAVKVDMGGNPATFSSKGTVKGDEITLTTTNDAGMDMGGEMKLKRQAK